MTTALCRRTRLSKLLCECLTRKDATREPEPSTTVKTSPIWTFENRNLVAPGLTTRSKEATRGSWHRYERSKDATRGAKHHVVFSHLNTGLLRILDSEAQLYLGEVLLALKHLHARQGVFLQRVMTSQVSFPLL